MLVNHNVKEIAGGSSEKIIKEGIVSSTTFVSENGDLAKSRRNNKSVNVENISNN